MKLMLLHLSDIHASESGNHGQIHVSEIVDAVKNLDHGYHAAFVVISGDIANSGSELEYVEALEQIEKLKDTLEEKLRPNHFNGKVPVYIVSVPGNHDCNLRDEDELREILLEKFRTDKETSINPQIIDSCTSVQDNYFQFLQCLSESAPGGELARPPAGRDRLAWVHSFPVSDEKWIDLHCLNTAWLCKRGTPPGTLVFPLELIPTSSDAFVTIAILHHPYNWFEPENARGLRSRLQVMADVILTGHEHDADYSKRQSVTGETTVYLEGDVLHLDNDAYSGFNVILLDVEARKQKYFHMKWAGEFYESGCATPEWTDLQVERLRRGQKFKLSPVYQAKLDDPDVSLYHSKKTNVKLHEFFVFPDLVEALPPIERSPKTIRSGQIVDFVLSTPHVLITGDCQSGKTSLAKVLFQELHTRGLVPVLVNGRQFQVKPDKVIQFIEERQFPDQYSAELVDSYRRADWTKKVIIIDDYHCINKNVRLRKDLLAQIVKMAKHVVVLADEFEYTLSDGSLTSIRAEDIGRFENYSIKALGFVLRNQLISRWLRLDEEVDVLSEEFAHKLTAINRVLNTLIGNNYVPAFPVYILAVLQGYEAGAPVDTRASTHGYFYELFIRSTLMRGRSGNEYDIIASYLSYMAHKFFEGRGATQELNAVASIHSDFEKRYDVKRGFETLKSQLLEQHIWIEHEGRIAFRYPFIYYYFVAAYLRDHIGEDPVRKTVATMCHGLHHEENANILLFLAHLSKDPLIIRELLESANTIYSNNQEATLTDDANFLLELKVSLPELALATESHIELRERSLQELDENTDSPNNGYSSIQVSNEESDADEIPESARQFAACFRSMQIIGQILKNFPGSLEGNDKLSMAESCCNLGFRLLAEALRDIREAEAAWTQEIAVLMRKEHPSMSSEQLLKRVEKNIRTLGEFICFCVIRRISYDIGSPELFTTYDRLADKLQSPAFRLLYAALILDQNDSFSDRKIVDLGRDIRKHRVAYDLLRRLVWEHMLLFPVAYRKKQRVCEALEISYRAAAAVEFGQKVVQ